MSRLIFNMQPGLQTAKGVRRLFKIGEFSKLVRISVRMLRHYEKCGLLYPAEIDQFTGYRQYAASQIPLAHSIVQLRDLGFSIAEIANILPHIDDSSYMRMALSAKAEAVRLVIESEQNRLELLDQMSKTFREEYRFVVYDVELKSIPAVEVISLRAIIPAYNQEGILWEKLGRYVGAKDIPCKSDGYSTYFDDEYKEADVDVEIAIPVLSMGEDDGEFKYQIYSELPLAASVRFTGQHEGGYSAACSKLAGWLEENGYRFAGPMRGHVIISPDDEKDPEKWETEIQAPVMKA